MARIDFDALQTDVLLWYDTGDQAAATRAYRALEPLARSIARRQQASWGADTVADTVQIALTHALDREARRLDRTKTSFKGLCQTVIARKALSAGRKLGVGKKQKETLKHAAEGTSPGQPPFAAAGTNAQPSADRRLVANEELGWVGRALMDITQNRALSLIAELAPDEGPDVYPRPRAHAAERQGRDDATVRGLLAIATHQVPQTKADAALGPGKTVNTFQQNLSRARKDLRKRMGARDAEDS